MMHGDPARDPRLPPLAGVELQGGGRVISADHPQTTCFSARPA
jgi:hypothetical protein